ncbi:hypothetical protein B0T18DRAFT_421305 [Schizothecium vesticola]|uniref:Uncharacterized protein n=1 Tax=Schizothecium vesticola TaxID=314040 RepID=A0AA40EFN2_9PEZI|nr:hypothetical protein B0T18DRAFT_421305 [Schizothecium vesticola]
MTDIALAKLNLGIKFENRLMDVQATAKKLVHSSNIAYYDELLIDAFPTGVQRLMSVGSRIAFERGKGSHPKLRAPNGDESLLPPSNVTYIAARQGVCATGDPILTDKPYIRDRACGAVLLRCKDASGKTSSRDVLARREVCGMFHYADLTPKYANSASEYLIYAESFDPLIEEGWQVVPLPGEEAETNIQ